MASSTIPEKGSIPYEKLSEEQRKSLNLNDILLVDRLDLSQRARRIGAVKAVIFSALAIFVFFRPNRDQRQQRRALRTHL